MTYTTTEKHFNFDYIIRVVCTVQKMILYVLLVCLLSVLLIYCKHPTAIVQPYIESYTMYWTVQSSQA